MFQASLYNFDNLNKSLSKHESNIALNQSEKAAIIEVSESDDMD